MTLIVLFLIIALCLLSNINYFTDGKSIYHINSVASSPLLYIKLQIDNFRNLDFVPQYWTNQCYTGGPIHTGLGFYNPSLVLLAFFGKFSSAIIFYDILLKFIAGLGTYFLLRKYEFSAIASASCALIYPLNPYCAAFGQDPQMASIVYLLPLVILTLDLLIANYADIMRASTYGLILAVVLSVCYLSSNIQSYAFFLWFIIAPFVLFRIYSIYNDLISRDKVSLIDTFKPITTIICLIGAAFLLNLLLVLFEILPTLNVIEHGTRDVSFDRKIIVYSMVIFFVAFAIHSRQGKTVTSIGVFLLILIFVCDPKTGAFFDPSINYVQKIDPSAFIFDNQPMRYYAGIAQLCLLIFVLFKRQRSDRRLILFDISMAYFAVSIFLMIEYGVKNYGLPGVLAGLGGHILPDYYYRCSFIPFIGLVVGIAYGIDSLGSSKEIGKATLMFLLAALILPVENCYLYLNRTLFTDGLDYVEKECPEYDFLRDLRPTERVISVYNNEHREWGKSFRPEIMPKWLIPPYLGASTFSRVGVAIIPKRNSDYNQMAMPLYFGVDEKAPLTNLLSLAGVKYLFSYNRIEAQGDLELIRKGDEYFIYENKKVLPRLMLAPSVAKAKKKMLAVAEGPQGRQVVEITGAGIILVELMKSKTHGLLGKVFVEREKDIVLNNSGKNEVLFMSDNAFSSSLGEVKLVQYQDEYVEIDCDIREECFFMMTDTFYPGWNVYVGEEQKEILRANHIFRGLKLYPGKYVLTFRYESLANRYGLYISFISFIIVLCLLAALLFFNRRVSQKVTVHG